MTDDMENIVRKDMKESWDRLKKTWFVIDEKDPYDIRYPGKMKLEWSTAKGGMVR